ncbi:MAG: class I SAM-dependent methyltransferase, partial [Asgard group archaeon]|nr:class I SAM-dependent methyltransferase [Asgard group archaeon]
KYSCCLWRNPNKSIKKEVNLNQAEKDMLALTCERAQMKDGLKVLDLGCGWGSLTIYLAQNYPKATITAVSNSAIQIAFIDKKVKKLGLRNVKTIKADVKNFTITEQFDRIISIEMFEHMRNYQKLFQKIQQFLKDNGKLFIHIFTHKNQPYLFEKDDETDFMAKYFFTGGTLPTADILFYFAENFTIEHHWRINGKHYEKTLNSWLWKMKKKKQQLLPIIEDVYGSKNKRKWWVYWKVFFIANAAIFGWKKGNHWFVSHYLFKKKE